MGAGPVEVVAVQVLGVRMTLSRELDFDGPAVTLPSERGGGAIETVRDAPNPVGVRIRRDDPSPWEQLHESRRTPL